MTKNSKLLMIINDQIYEVDIEKNRKKRKSKEQGCIKKVNVSVQHKEVLIFWLNIKILLIISLNVQKNRQQQLAKVDQDMIEQKLNDGSIKRYLKGRLLGKGGFAKCYQLISLQTQKKYAAKLIEKASLEKSKAKEKLTSQIKIHKSLDHPYVVHFQHYFEDAQFVYILLEKCPNQTLNELLKRRKRLTDIEAKYYARQLAFAIKYIHDEQIIHRDLKLGNLFLSEKLEIKIGDFGLATKLSYRGERKKTKCGTPNYIAPEILDDNKTHSFEVDVWSMGVITYALLVGKPPFETSEVKDTYTRIKTCHYSFPDSANVSEIAKTFISKMLQLDPLKRATIEQVLADPFLAQSTIPTLLPISSLACPPSYDFLKKYRDLQARELKHPSAKHASSFLLQVPEEQKKCNISNYMSQQKSSAKKPINRVNSQQKLTKLPARVSSAINLLQINNVKSNKTNKMRNELQKQTLKIWVTYFDENPKYGIGYLLNSNAVGFKYNDYTAMISNSKQTQIKYIEYDPISRKMKEDQQIVYKPSQVEAKQAKKYKILTHFHRQLMRTKRQTQSQLQNQLRIRIEQTKFRQTTQTAMKCFVSRYHRTDKCTIFWLSISAIQIIFTDNSQILIIRNKGQSVFTYVNKFKERIHFQEKNQQGQSDEIKKRLLHFYTFIKSISITNEKQIENQTQNLLPKSLQKTTQKQSEVPSISYCSSVNVLPMQDTNKTLRVCSSNSNQMKNKKKV